MPYIKCSDGHRTQAPTSLTECPICGKPFITSGPSPAPTSASGSMPYPPVPVPGPFSPVPAPSRPAPPIPRPTPFPPAPTSRPAPPAPVPAPTSTSLFGPVPSNMPSRVPDLEGTVALPPVVSEIQLPADWSTAALGCIFIPFILVFRPLLVIMGLLSAGSRTPRKRTINTVRIKRADGTLREARFEGDLMGGGVSLGDELSVWGSDRSGVLIAKRAFNHTAGGEIRIEQHAPWATRALAILLLVFIFAIILSVYSYR